MKIRTYPVLRRFVRIDSIRIGSFGEILLNKLWPTTVVGGVVGDLDEDESDDKLTDETSDRSDSPISSIEVPLPILRGADSLVDI
jgi:hypothetical protein